MIGTIEEIIENLKKNHDSSEIVYCEIWVKNDVESRNKDMSIIEELKDLDCERILHGLENTFDANNGTSWDSIDAQLEMCKN